MADVQETINCMLAGEDGAVIRSEDGKRARFGIDERFHPELTNCLFYTPMGKVAALQIARGIYEVSYCEPLCVAEIQHLEVATTLVDLARRVGLTRAGRWLQEAVTVEGDGRIGPLTLHAVDLMEPAEVVERLRDLFQVRKRGWVEMAGGVELGS